MATNILLEWISSIITPGFLSICYTILFVLAAQAGLSVFNTLGILSKSSAGNEVTGIFFGAISLVYSLILAFVIVAVWEDYEDLDKTIENEADKLNSILAHSVTLPDTTRHRVTDAVFAYCHRVIDEEWKMKRRQEMEQPSAIPDMRLMLLKARPRNESDQTVYTVIDTDLSTISDLRRSRLNHNRSHVPDLVWFILKSGSVMLVAFSYFFDITSLPLKRVYLFFLASCIAMCMFLVYTLDHPFTGSAMVSTSPFENVLAELEKYYVINP